MYPRYISDKLYSTGNRIKSGAKQFGKKHWRSILMLGAAAIYLGRSYHVKQKLSQGQVPLEDLEFMLEFAKNSKIYGSLFGALGTLQAGLETFWK